MLSLRPYQEEDIKFLSQRNRSACFNEQRTGKTPTALLTLQKKNCRKILIICPTSTILPWVEEYEKWLGRPCVPLIGSRHHKNLAIENWTHGLVVSYDSFKNTRNYTGFAEPILSAKPDGVILDEAHRIKGRVTKAAEAAYKCKNIPHRIALTATPGHNRPHEIFPILKWLYPKTFSSYWKFVEHFFYVYQKKNQHGSSYREIGDFLPGKEKELAKLLNQFSTQRKRIEVMPWLPKEEPPIRIKLTPTDLQRKYLRELNEYYETENIITQGILDRLIRERQICLHPGILDLKGPSPKIKWIKQYIKDYPENHTIIFSKFTTFLKILSKELNLPHGLIIGETPLSTRQRYIKKFQSDPPQTLLINIDCGKEGLTLDRADDIIFTDIFPPVGDIEQAKARFIPTTEFNIKAQRIFELMLTDTYDEQIYKNIHRLKTEADVVNDYKQYLERS